MADQALDSTEWAGARSSSQLDVLQKKMKGLYLLIPLLFMGCHTRSERVESSYTFESPLIFTGFDNEFSTPSAFEEGGLLADDPLLRDTTATILEMMGIDESEQARFLRLASQESTGKPGYKAWKEVWLYAPGGPGAAAFLITFQEDGSGSHDFSIERLQNKPEGGDGVEPAGKSDHH